jgi:bifunctional UDP-N-acetylglucosamine pyrophosphorylase/glucosamine-1-phosphate N-acetyltransferase
MTDRPVAAIVLAAGKGTRMKSDTHKVLHPIAGRPMLLHLLASLEALAPAAKVIVVGDKAEQVEAAVAPLGAVTVRQEPQLGTAHATLMAKQALAGFDGDVLVMFGDVPLIETATMRAMLAALHRSPDTGCAVLGFRPADPAAYGRILAHPDGTIEKMVEFKDATTEERAVTLCNSGLMAVRAKDLFGWLDRVGNDNAQGEYYLPDVVMIAAADGRRSLVVETQAEEVAGINSRAELAAVETAWQQRRRVQAMADGVTLTAPDTVWFSHDTALGRDVTVGPNVVFGPGVTVADGATIHAFCHLEGCTVGPRAEVGPYARLRPGADLGEKAKVGNFVEVKKAKLGKGAKANHLAYLGDADIGAGANIGAGTITCNYDGFFKYRTVVGEGAFIGSNSSLVAPVTIGAGAIVAAGSAVTRDVPADTLRLVRPEQADKPGWAAKFRAAMTARKKGA